MARSTRDELSQLTAIMDLCRAKGVIKLVRGPSGELEMLFGPAPAQRAKPEDRDARAGKREHYMNLLGRHVADPELDMLP